MKLLCRTSPLSAKYSGLKLVESLFLANAGRSCCIIVQANQFFSAKGKIKSSGNCIEG